MGLFSKDIKNMSGCSASPARNRRASTVPLSTELFEEAQDVAGDVEPKPVLDAALIAAAQAVEHYEITQYGTLIAWAK